MVLYKPSIRRTKPMMKKTRLKRNNNGKKSIRGIISSKNKQKGRTKELIFQEMPMVIVLSRRQDNIINIEHCRKQTVKVWLSLENLRRCPRII